MQRLYNLPWRILPDWALGNRLKILMYHSISENPGDPHAISLNQFQKQMKFLQTKKVLQLTEALEHLKNGSSLKETFVITFDDALLDFYNAALPVLKEYGYPATLFIPTGFVGQTAAWDSYDKTKPLMSWKQLEKCREWKVSFGSHTVHHALLTECGDEMMRTELAVSLQTLCERLGCISPAMAYPGGYHDPRVREATSAAGYSCALGGASRWGNGPESDLFQLRRQRFDR